MMFDHDRPVVTKDNEARIDHMIEQDFASHRECPTGRNFLAWNMRNREFKPYRDKFDETFEDATGGKKWLDEQFCPGCDRRKSMCRCAEGVTAEDDVVIGFHSGLLRRK